MTEPHRHCFWDGVYIASTPTGNGIPQFCSEECEKAASYALPPIVVKLEPVRLGTDALKLKRLKQ